MKYNKYLVYVFLYDLVLNINERRFCDEENVDFSLSIFIGGLYK